MLQVNSYVTLVKQQGILAFFSAIFSFLYLFASNPGDIRAGTVFQGWTASTVLIMLMQSIHGLLVALTIQHWGIVFRFALGALSISISILLESIFFDDAIKLHELICICLVIVGSNMYHSKNDTSK